MKKIGQTTYNLLQSALFLALFVVGMFGTVNAQETASGADSEIVLVQVEKNPELLNWDFVQNQLAYPDDCFEMELEGTIPFKVLIGTDGRVMESEIPTGIHPSFVKAIQNVIGLIQASPGMYQGKPIPTWHLVSLTFDHKAEKKRRKKD